MTKENYKKIDLINFISSKIGFPKDYSKKLTNDLLLILNENIVNGYLNLKNIGTFKLLYKKKELDVIQKQTMNLLYPQEKPLSLSLLS